MPVYAVFVPTFRRAEAAVLTVSSHVVRVVIIIIDRFQPPTAQQPENNGGQGAVCPAEAWLHLYFC